MTTTQPGPDPEKCSIYSRYPLDSNIDQIRLLTVHDGAGDEPIQCSIHVVSLHEKPLYRALSYVWGDPKPQKEIFIDGQTFSVRPNLFDAIRGFRGGWPSWKVRDVVIWIDAICIDQENLSERNHQVAMMDKIYSKCVEVIVWLGDFDKHLSTSTESYNADIQYNPPATEPHAIGCQCLDAVWARSENVQWTSTPTKALTIAWSVIRKIEAASNCDDLQVCRLFRNAEEMSAFRFFTDYIHKNPWFTRTWVVQEAVLAPQTNIYMETWLMSLHILTGAARTFVYHGNRGCCYPSFKKYKNLEWTLLFNQLGYMRSHSQRAAGLDGLLNVRAFMIGKTASLDHDLLYGMLGMLRTEEQIIPRYDRPVEEAYTEFSRHYLQIPSSCDCAVVTLFAFTPLRARYPCLPSWAIDHTIFEDGYLDGIRTYAWALADYKHLQLRTSGSSHGLKFHENHLILSGRFIDSINTIGQVNMYRASTDDPDHSVIHTWRDVVLARKSAHEPYILPDGYNGKSYDWATAWLRTLCANRRLSGDENHVIQLTREEMAIIISDARRDPSNLLVLQHTPTLNRDLEAQMLIPTARPDLYRQVYYVLSSVCYRSRIFLNQNDYLGIGNIDIQCGDRIFLSARCGRPVILRPVDGSVSKWGRTTYRIVSSSYLDGFMDGPEEGVEFPCEEVWVE